jgi:hypothetical protein
MHDRVHEFQSGGSFLFMPWKTYLTFEFFSLIKELRYYAYLGGNIKPPASVTMDPFVQFVNDTPDATPATEDQFQSISAQSQYDKHSHEVRFSNFYLTYQFF